MPLICGSNWQAPTRSNTCIQGDTMSSRPSLPIPERSTVQHQMTGVLGRNVAVVTVARHRCVLDDESCSLRCEPPPPCRQGSPVISCVTELNGDTGSEGRDGMVRVLYGEDPGAQGYEGGQPGRADIRADSSLF